MRKPDLLLEQILEINQKLYEYSLPRSKERQQSAQALWEIAQNQELTTEQRLLATVVPLTTRVATIKDINFQETTRAVQVIIELLEGNTAKDYLAKHWDDTPFEYGDQKVNIADVPFIVQIIKQEIVPEHIRNYMYDILSEMIPLLNEVSTL